MAFELPSMPKHVVINLSLIAAIGLSAIVAVVMLWQFMPLFTSQINEPVGQPKLNLNMTYTRDLTVGMQWTVSGTASNTGNETLRDIIIRIHSDGNMEGTNQTISTIEPGTSVPFTLRPRVKSSAAVGQFTAQLSVSVPDMLPTEYELSVTISPLQPGGNST